MLFHLYVLKKIILKWGNSLKANTGMERVGGSSRHFHFLFWQFVIIQLFNNKNVSPCPTLQPRILEYSHAPHLHFFKNAIVESHHIIKLQPLISKIKSKHGIKN